MPQRQSLQSHPWINFIYKAELDPLWASLGEAYSKCQHLSGTPVKPGIAAHLSSVYLSKGALASTAIEGNTLNEAQALQIMSGELQLPESQQYLEQEVRNVVDAMEAIAQAASNHQPLVITEEWLRQQNRLVLNKLEVADHVVPGEYTTSQLVVGSYRAAPPEDVPYLMGQLTEWLNESWLSESQQVDCGEDYRFYWSFFAAALGHLYLAWIHPFGDGNGRTARLLEYAILVNSGVVPTISAGLLSNHYNSTRQRYYGRLDAASKTSTGVTDFIRYAAQGFVDLIRQQIEDVQQMQRRIAWESYVYEMFQDEQPAGTMKDRRRQVALALSENQWMSYREIIVLTPKIARLYASLGPRTCARDMADLVDRGLAVKLGSKFRSGIDKIDGFKPVA